MSDVDILIDCSMGGEGLGAEQVEVVWEEGEMEMEKEARDYVEARWGVYVAEAKGAGRMLFNGAIMRLIGVEWGEGGKVELRLGGADYKTFVVTRLRDRGWFEGRAPGAMVKALGNSALVTRGDRAIFGVRSEAVVAYGGRAHVLGGVLERLGTAAFPAGAAGLVAHLRVELEEEAGMRAGELAGEPRLLGVMEDHFLGQPEAVWRWESAVALEEVARRLETGEHVGSVVVGREGVAAGVWEVMTPVAREAWRMWAGGWK